MVHYTQLENSMLEGDREMQEPGTRLGPNRYYGP